MSVKECKTFRAPGSASAFWECSLDLPNSYAKDDGIRLCVTSEGSTQELADENACRLAFAHLLMDSPGLVVLRPKHWNIPSQELLDKMPVAVPPPQALPVHVNPKQVKMKREAGTQRYTDPADVWSEQVAKVLREILRTHARTFDPSSIHYSWMGRRSYQEHMYEKLNQLLEKGGGLRNFVDNHPEFTWQRHGKNGMVIKWAW